MESTSVSERITELAAALMLPNEIAILLDINTRQFEHHLKHSPDSDWYRAFHKGRLQTKFELRKKIVSLAKAGSPQAELLADKYLQQTP
jgi:hypothetical protein